jgi:serine/threonine-protein kinase
VAAPQSAPQPPPRKPRKRLIIALTSVAAAAAIIIAVVAAISVANSGERGHSPSAGPADSAPPNTGPFTGVYRADFSASTLGELDAGSTPATGRWEIRSVCRSACLATATAKSGPTIASQFVFDDVGLRWIAVSTTSATSEPSDPGFRGCKFPTEIWEVLTLQPRADGTLSGDYTAATPDNCFTARTVTFTRTEDVDVNSLPDPATQPPRVTSPAEALRGRYHATLTFLTGSRVVDKNEADLFVRTDCLRTGERCMSFFRNESNTARPLVFAGEKWTHKEEKDYQPENCAGATAHRISSSEYPLPQPPQDPIAVLTGHGHQTITGPSCVAGEYDVEEKFERTGD